MSSTMSGYRDTRCSLRVLQYAGCPFVQLLIEVLTQCSGRKAAVETDLTIICNNADIGVHRERLSAVSTVLSNIIDSKRDTERGTLEIADQDQHVVGAALHYLYYKRYDDQGGNDPSRPCDMLFNAQVFALANTWKMEDLQEFAANKFATSVDETGSMEDYMDVVQAVYSSLRIEDSYLRDTVSKVIASNMEKMMASGAKIYETAANIGDFAVDVMKMLAKDKKAHTSYRCRKCSRVFRAERLRKNDRLNCVACGKAEMMEV